MNGDGLSDFIIGAPEGGTVGEFDGEAYVVFGQVWKKVFRNLTDQTNVSSIDREKRPPAVF